ncbi:helix-turn-helix domain-containing protein [Streptomyces sp. NBC_00354]|uniref:helix-turn-helix domain-containing protein n=1 Tax=Streptomyces sp. NBC_00354 TaxID=2975723 RepID=UPI002E276CA0|nr:helix-turn-helix domain-containing protein [Streptomyces sp. NBC_01001]
MPALPEPLPEPVAPVLPMGNDPARAAADRLLGQELRRCREARGLTLRQVAPVIRGSVSKISRLERGESPPKPRDVRDLARYYGVDAEELRAIERLLEHAQDSEWYEQFSDVTPDFLRRLIQLEGDSEEICVYENLVVPGILQTRDYARFMVRAVMPGADPDEVERVVELRTERQLRLMDSPLPRVTALLEEGVLHRRCGNAAVMHEQLNHLLRAGDTDKVSIRILRMTREYGATPPYPITHLKFRDGEHAELAYVEHINGANYVTRPRALDDYRNALSNLRNAAASKDESVELILEAKRQFGDGSEGSAG